MNVEFKEPWIAVGEFALSVTEELQREFTEGHPLSNLKVCALARRVDSDDVLFAVERDGQPTQFAVVHLTWRGRPEPDPRWPETELFGSLEQWARERMMADHEAFIGN